MFWAQGTPFIRTYLGNIKATVQFKQEQDIAATICPLP